jgi:tetratricopeptide (TPR) repeat protein
MRRLTLLSICSLLFASTTKGQEHSLPELLKIMRPAVVLITAYDSNSKPAWTGTGFFISDQVLVTNYHMINGAASEDVKLESGKILPVAGVIAEDADADVAELSLNTSANDHGILSIASERAPEGSKIVVLGNPRGFEKTLSDGIVSAYRDYSNTENHPGKWMQITAPTSHGSSGSPIVNMQGSVVGVLSWGLSSGENLNFAVPVEKISGLKKHEILSFDAWAAREHAAMLNNPDGLYKLAQNSYNNNQYLESEKLCENALVKNPNSSKTWRLLSLNESALGENEIAINSAEQAVKADSISAAAWATLGASYRISKRFQEAIICYKRALLFDSLNDSYLNSLAVTLSAGGRKKEAIETYHRAIRYGPDNATALCNLGIASYNAGDYANSMTYLTQAAIADTEWAKPHLWLAYWYRDSAMYGDEEKEAHKALTLYPDYFDAHLLLGKHYYYQKNYSTARKELEACYQIDSTEQDALSFLGWSCLDDGDIKQSLVLFIAEERNYPQDVGAILDVGFAYYSDSDYGDAIRAYNRALKLDPTNLKAYNRLARVFEQLKDYEQALDAYKNALEIDPQEPYTLANVGEMYLKKREYENAQEYLKSSLAIKADNTRAKANLGIACLHIGKKAEALEIYDSIKSSDPENAQRLFAEIYPSRK